jgi:DNA-directed RNA polymerase subunit RPC12/RpoP
MQRVPLQFTTITCLNCGAIMALLPPGALIVTTKLRCVHCSADRTLKPVDSRERESSVGLILAPA